MSAAELATVITAAAGLVAAIAALVAAWRGQAAINTHIQDHADSTPSAARQPQPPSAGHS